jgi:hypothetical protein
LPAEPEWIARKMRVDDATYHRVVAPILSEFFRRNRGRFYQKRLSQEFVYVEAISNARKEAGKKGGFSKALKNNENGNGKANSLPQQNDSKNVAPTPTPTPTLFPEDKSSGPDTPADDPEKAFWDTAKAYLGKSKASLVGKWAGTHGREATAQAITAAQIARAVDPVAYIEGYFRRHAAPQTERPIC